MVAGHQYRRQGRTYTDFPMLLADKATQLQDAEYKATAATGAIIDLYGAIVLGSILLHGRRALRVAWRCGLEFADWDHWKMYEALLHIARVTGPWTRNPNDHWTPVELLASASLSNQPAAVVMDLRGKGWPWRCFWDAIHELLKWRRMRT